MKWNEHTDKLCPIAQTLGVIGEYWSLLILRNSFMGVKRFDEFQEQLGMTRHVLAGRLKTLVEHGVLKKVPYGENAGRFEYRLTEKGLDLYPVMMTMASWGNKWLFEEGQEPIVHIHNTCDKPTKPIINCSECGDPLYTKEVTIASGKPLVELAKTKDNESLTKELGFRPPIRSV